MTVKGYIETMSGDIVNTAGSIKVETKPQTFMLVDSINGVNTLDKNAQNVSKKLIEVVYEDSKPENLLKFPTSNCNRCKKKFAQTGPKAFKMCEHCRILQRQRSRRWQKRTKLKEGVCTRCGSELPLNDNNFVLCQHCRDMLRSKKANRYLEGKCVHCSGPNDEEGVYKVCKRCREKDKLRRLSLEHNGLCNRCTSRIPSDQKGHKICQSCRMKKRKVSISLDHDSLLPERAIIRNVDVNDLFTDEIILKDKRLRQRKKANKPPIIDHRNNISAFASTSKLDTNSSNKDIDFDIKHNAISIADNRLNNDIDNIDNNKNRSNNYNNEDNNDDDGNKHRHDNNKRLGNENNDNKNDNNSNNNSNNSLNNELTKECVREQYVTNITNINDSNTRSIHDNTSTSEVNGNDVEPNRNEYNVIQNSNESITSTMILAESFNIPHDHSQLNQQLKQLGQFTSHSSDEGEDDVDDVDEDDEDNNDDNDDGREDDEDDTNNGNAEDFHGFNEGYCNNDNNENNEKLIDDVNNDNEIDENDDPNTSKNMAKNESILVDMEYSLNDGTSNTLNTEEENVEFEEENETMLRHVRAVQAGLLSNTTEPSDAEIAAAVEAVAVAAAVAQSRNENVK